MPFMPWLGAGSLIGARINRVLTGGAAAPAERISYHDMGYQNEPRIEVEHIRTDENLKMFLVVDKESLPFYCELTDNHWTLTLVIDRWNLPDMEEVHGQHFQFFCDNSSNVTQSHSDQNPEETQETGTQMHHSLNLLFPGQIITRQKIELMKKKEKKENKINNEDNITFMAANVCSLKNKAHKVRMAIEDKQVDVACLNETFLKDDDAEMTEMIMLSASGPGFAYQIKNSDAFKNCARRGVAIMCSEHLEVSEDVKRTLDSLTPEDSFEFVPSLVQHKKWNVPILVISLYRPTEPLNEHTMNDFLWDLEDLLREAKNHKHIIVTGDFNIPVAKMNMFNCFLEKHNLQQHVNQPTRDSGRILDLVITKNVQVSNLSVGPEKISDHYPVFFDARPKPPNDE